MIKDLEDTLEIEGCTIPFDLAFQYCWCKYIKSINNSLNTLEIGYFKGRTTELVLRAGSTNHTVLEIQYEESPLHKNKATFIKGDSVCIGNKVSNLYGSIDYIFIDGGHTYSELISDLKLADKLLKRTGIVIVDDINIEYYNELVSALNDFIKATKCFYRVCKTPNEMVICRSRSFERYYKYALYQLPIDMYNVLDSKIFVQPSMLESFNCLENSYLYINPYGNGNNPVNYIGNLDWIEDRGNSIWVPTYINVGDLNKQANEKLVENKSDN